MVSYEFRWKYGYDPILAETDDEAQLEAQAKIHNDPSRYTDPYILRIEKIKMEILKMKKE